MADNTDIQDTSDDSKVIQMFQMIHPNADPAAIQSLVSDLKAAGNDQAAHNAIVQKYLSNTTSPQAAPTNVPVTPQAPTQLPDTYAGTGYSQADLLKQFSPAQLQAAYAQQQQMYQATQPSRAIGSIISGGSGSADVMNKNKSDWEAIDKQNMLQSIDRQKALQDQATAGLTAGTTAQTQNIAAGKYTGTQAEQNLKNASAQSDLIVKQLSTEQQQRLNQADSPETMMAKNLLLSQLASIPTANQQALREIVTRPGVTAMQLMPAMGVYAPAALKAYTEAIGANKTIAETGKTVAETTAQNQSNKLVAQDQGLKGTGAPTPTAPQAPAAVTSPAINAGENKAPTFNFAPGTDLRVMRNAMASQPANVLAAFDKQFPDVANATGPVYAGGTPAPASNTPAPAPTPSIGNAGRGTINPPQGGPNSAQAQALSRIAQNASQTPAVTKADANNHDPAYLAEQDDKALSDIQLLEKQALKSTDPQEIIRLNRQIADMKGIPYKAPASLSLQSVGGTGGASLGQTGLISGNNARTSADISETANQLAGFTQTGKTAAQQAILNSKLGGLQATNMVTGGNPAAQNFANQVNKLNQDAQNLGVLSKGENNAGALLTAGGTAIAAGAPGGLAKMGGVALSALGGLLGGGQAITAKSDPKVIAATGVAVQEVAAKKQMLLAQQQAYADQHNGDGTGFINSPTYKAIVNAQPLINPTTGDVIVPVTAQDRIAAKKAGYGNASTYIGGF